MTADLASMSLMTWFAIGYGLVLLLIAYGIDHMAKRAAAKLEASRTSGFVYHADHDAWLCPQDEWLWPQSFDKGNRVMRYRANPSVCASCPIRDTCLNPGGAGGGREIQRHVDPWPASESARFHRGIACTIAVLGAVWPFAQMFAAESSVEEWALLITLVVVLTGSLPLWNHLRRSPADPLGIVSRSADENVDDRAEANEKHLRRHPAYWSDRRPASAPDTTRTPDTTHTRGTTGSRENGLHQ